MKTVEFQIQDPVSEIPVYDHRHTAWSTVLEQANRLSVGQFLPVDCKTRGNALACRVYLCKKGFKVAQRKTICYISKNPSTGASA